MRGEGMSAIPFSVHKIPAINRSRGRKQRAHNVVNRKLIPTEQTRFLLEAGTPFICVAPFCLSEAIREEVARRMRLPVTSVRLRFLTEVPSGKNWVLEVRPEKKKPVHSFFMQFFEQTIFRE